MLYILIFRCLDSTLTIVTYLSSNVNIFKDTLPSDSRIFKQKYSLCSDHLAVSKLFSEWNSLQNRRDVTQTNDLNNNYSLSRNNLILMQSKYKIHESLMYYFVSIIISC